MSRTHVPWRCGQDVFRILVVCVWFDYVLRGASDRGAMKDGSKDGRKLPIEVLCSYGSRMLKDI